MDPNSGGKRDDLDTVGAASALRWWWHAGVTIALDHAPRNRFVEGAPQALNRSGIASSETVSPHFETLDPWAGRSSRADAAPVVGDAAGHDIAASSPDLATLRSNLQRFEGCALKRTATQLVFADGVPGSRVMFVGEAPGADEDRIGRPFVGRAGQLLDRMLNAVGLNRQSVYIANVVPWRPPGNRTPTPQETQACLPFIKRQIELAAPEILVCLGASATQTLLGVREAITRARGTWLTYSCESGRSIRAIVMLHPAYLLRQSGHKRQAWSDMRALAIALNT